MSGGGVEDVAEVVAADGGADVDAAGWLGGVEDDGAGSVGDLDPAFQCEQAEGFGEDSAAYAELVGEGAVAGQAAADRVARGVRVHPGAQLGGDLLISGQKTPLVTQTVPVLSPICVVEHTVSTGTGEVTSM
nr:hypothetical protein [Frankia sp. ArI3]